MSAKFLSYRSSLQAYKYRLSVAVIFWFLGYSGIYDLGCVTPALAAPQNGIKSDGQADLAISPSPDTRIRKIGGGAAYYFGQISGLAPQEIIHTFLLSNDTDRTLILDHLQPSCGCISAVLNQNAPATQYVFAPHKQVAITLTLDPTEVTPGAVHKTVWVFVKGEAAPAATLALTGTVLPVAAFSTPVVDFGSVGAGTRLTQLLTVKVDPTALPAGATWRLVSSNPDVVSAPVAEALAPDNAGAGAARSFRVTLTPQARLGTVQGSLSVVVTVPGSPGTTSGAVPLAGQVTGDIAAAPAALAFGEVPFGQGAREQTLLTGKALSGFTAVSSSPYVTARLQPVPGSIGALSLTATLNPRTPAGPLDAEVVVTTPTGQRLRVPAFAIVTAAH